MVYDNNKKIKCITCSCVVITHNMNHHVKTKKHIVMASKYILDLSLQKKILNDDLISIKTIDNIINGISKNDKNYLCISCD